MVSSMTGFGRGEAGSGGTTITVEVRSVNSRFLEVNTRLPRSFSLRENDVKEFIRKRVSRGKITVLGTVDRESADNIPVRVNVPAARAYYKLLQELRKAVKSRESVKMDHLLRFSEVLEQEDPDSADDVEWGLLQEGLTGAMDELVKMRQDEGGELQADLQRRVASLESAIARIEVLSKDQIPQERERLNDRITQLTQGPSVDRDRLEMEIALMADKLDVTEECVRFRSHNKFFLEGMNGSDAAGRRLNFLVQEMNREANTIGSKSSSTEIAHLVVSLKEELEKIREQLQNIE